jgi:hypothetical protein
MSDSSQKIFTVSEARELLPELRPRLHEMKEIWTELQPHRDEARKIGSRVDDGGATLPGAGEYFPLINRLKQKLAYFEKAGIELKDPAAGLIDFPSLRGGRVVYLCWRMDEETITHWHETNAGFAGRQPLEDANA